MHWKDIWEQRAKETFDDYMYKSEDELLELIKKGLYHSSPELFFVYHSSEELWFNKQTLPCIILNLV